MCYLSALVLEQFPIQALMTVHHNVLLFHYDALQGASAHMRKMKTQWSYAYTGLILQTSYPGEKKGTFYCNSYAPHHGVYSEYQQRFDDTFSQHQPAKNGIRVVRIHLILYLRNFMWMSDKLCSVKIIEVCLGSQTQLQNGNTGLMTYSRSFKHLLLMSKFYYFYDIWRQSKGIRRPCIRVLHSRVPILLFQNMGWSINHISRINTRDGSNPQLKMQSKEELYTGAMPKIVQRDGNFFRRSSLATKCRLLRWKGLRGFNGHHRLLIAEKWTMHLHLIYEHFERTVTHSIPLQGDVHM